VEVFLIVIFAILGLVVGSFLNVCIDRLPGNKSIVFPPSHCQACQRKLATRDLIPVVSYLMLRGRCRTCRAYIPKRIFWVELSTAVIFGLLAWHYGLSVELGVMAFYASLFTVIFVIDLEQGLILNKVVYPGMIVAFLLSLPWLGAEVWLTDVIQPSVASAALGGAIGFALFLVIALLSRGGMGWGDVKLAGLIGLATGFPMVFVAVITGAILGGIVAVIMLITRRRTSRGSIPFGPFLAATAMITLLWGTNILNWYLHLMQ
jgi:prepilin signal peptidase PulO-like enzyme (type II secretory pathway)